MSIVVIIIGLLFIGMGYWVKSSPNLIAGYNTMSAEKQKNVDIEGLSSFMKRSMITLGITLIVSYYFFMLIGFPILANSMMLVVTLLGTSAMTIKAQKFDHNEGKAQRTILIYFLLGFVIVGVATLIGYGMMPSKMEIGNDSVHFSGMYGFTVEVSEIESIELLHEYPDVAKRTNGFSFGTVKKGKFRMNNSDVVQMMVHSDETPFIVITRYNDKRIFINFQNPDRTRDAYEALLELQQD